MNNKDFCVRIGEMKNLLRKYFGFKDFRPLQEDVVNAVLNKEDVFVLMPTGGGKSLCYQLPALKLEGVTLVISPLIALMKDQVDSLKANGVSAEFINSSLSFQEIKRCEEKILQGKVKIIYVAPERMVLERFSLFLEKIKVSLIAVDEAHCISEWGHDFRPDYRNMKSLKKDFPKTPIIALTATATKKVQKDILKQLNLPDARIFISSFDRSNLKLRVVRKKNALQKLLKILENYKNESVIIYCFSRKDTESLSANLRENGYKAKAYHAGMTSEKRTKMQDEFIKDKIKIIVATIAFGMGIDKLDVRLIVHYSFPKSLEGYYQEVGRAGRDGLSSECVMFYSYADTSKHRYFIDQIRSEKIKKQAEKKLEKVIEYAETSSCKRRYILNYFGEDYHKENCEGCDSCLIYKEEFDATTISQKITSAVVHLEGRFGSNYVIDVLKGKNKKQIKERGHHLLSVYGIVDDFTDDNLKELVKSLIDKGLLERTKGEYPTLNITAKGVLFLKNREKINLPKPTVEEVFSKKEETFNYDINLFEKLRNLRKKIAEEMEVPSFVVFSDVSLQEMAYYIPSDLESFEKISGVGEKKLETFGSIFLKEIKKYADENNLKSKEIKSSPLKVKKVAGETYNKTKELLKKKMSVEEIATERKIKGRTVISHIEKIVKEDRMVDVNHLKPSEGVFKEIKRGFEKKGAERLKPVYDYLQGKYSYDDIALTRLFILKNKK
jgi:ATP-dependent DNA helicase RecQ